MPPTEEIRNEIKRRKFAQPGGLIEFIKYFWDVLEPTTEFVDGWALRAICEHLEAVSDGRITRLLINVPPGFAKSLIVNVFWPAWEWATIGAHLRYVSFSYAAHLTARDNEKFRDLILSKKYKQLYEQKFTLVKVGAEKVQSTKTGWKFASSVGGVGTGERGDRVLLDDPHNVREAESESVRESTVQWFREAMQNRLNDLARGVIIVIMQRVNEGDVSGCIIEYYKQYEHLCIPMEYDGRDYLEASSQKFTTSIGWEDPRTEIGELAWPERYPERVLAPFKNMPYVWSGQYMQSPEPRGGGIIKRDYWKIWDAQAQLNNDVKNGRYPDSEFTIAYFDGALGQKQENDWSALTVWSVWVETDEMQRTLGHGGTPSVMLLAAWRNRLTLHGKTDLVQMYGESKEEFNQRKKEQWGLVEHIADTCRALKVNKLLIEAKANGHDIANELRRLHGREDWMIVLDDPGAYDKTARMYSIQPYFANGRVWAPATDWAQMVIDEVASFPKGRWDDLCDCTSGSLRHLHKMGLLTMSFESAIVAEEARFPSKPRRRTLYEV